MKKTASSGARTKASRMVLNVVIGARRVEPFALPLRHDLERSGEPPRRRSISRGVNSARETRPTRCDIPLARAILLGADPERVQRAALEMKTEAHRFAAQCGQIIRAFPLY